MIGVMKAKLEARNTGTWRPVTSWNSRVPMPAVNSATFGSRPVISGISTSAKCHEEHLRARNDLAPERVVEAVLHGQASFAWCRRSCHRHRPGPARCSRVRSGAGRSRRCRSARPGGLFNHFDAFWRSDQDHGSDLFAAGLFQQVDGGDHRTAGGQHRVDDQARRWLMSGASFSR